MANVCSKWPIFKTRDFPLASPSHFFEISTHEKSRPSRQCLPPSLVGGYRKLFCVSLVLVFFETIWSRFSFMSAHSPFADGSRRNVQFFSDSKHVVLLVFRFEAQIMVDKIYVHLTHDQTYERGLCHGHSKMHVTSELALSRLFTLAFRLSLNPKQRWLLHWWCHSCDHRGLVSVTPTLCWAFMVC